MFFQVTWDKKLPKGCKAYGFKSRELPSKVVLSSSGTECQMFQSKNVRIEDKKVQSNNLLDLYI